MNRVILIPTAKNISKELETIGKIPPIIYPLDQKIVFEYIIEEYGIESKYRLACSESIDLVKEAMKKYQNMDISIINIELKKDLGNTILQSINEKDTEIIINFGDTIVTDKIPNLDNWFFYSIRDENESWTYFTFDNERISNIYDKSLRPSVKQGNVFTGVFCFSDAQLLKRYLLECDNFEIDSFYQALLKYSEVIPLKGILTKEWLDIGHPQEYWNTQKMVKSRAFNNITLDSKRGVIEKTSKDADKLIGEIKWYLKLPSELEYCSPRIFSYSLAYDKPFAKMEYYPYHTIHELLLYGDIGIDRWNVIFNHVKFIFEEFSKYEVRDCARIENSLREMYIKKTITRMDHISKIEYFKDFFNNRIIINGVKYKPLSEIEKILETELTRLCNIHKFNIIHGDLCFTNLLIDENLQSIKLIDPRGKFGSFDIYGDRRYDLAKLFHSMDGCYDRIIDNMFDLSVDKTEINFKIKKGKESELMELFITVFEDIIGSERDNIEIIEGTLFLTMIPLHKEKQNRTYVMLGTALEILGRHLNIKERLDEPN